MVIIAYDYSLTYTPPNSLYYCTSATPTTRPWKRIPLKSACRCIWSWSRDHYPADHYTPVKNFIGFIDISQICQIPLFRPEILRFRVLEGAVCNYDERFARKCWLYFGSSMKFWNSTALRRNREKSKTVDAIMRKCYYSGDQHPQQPLCVFREEHDSCSTSLFFRVKCR